MVLCRPVQRYLVRPRGARIAVPTVCMIVMACMIVRHATVDQEMQVLYPQAVDQPRVLPDRSQTVYTNSTDQKHQLPPLLLEDRSSDVRALFQGDLANFTRDLHAINDKPSNPTAHVYTTLRSHPNHPPRLAYRGTNEQFFWGTPPHANDVLLVIFDAKQRIDTVQVWTGHPERPRSYLQFGVLEGSAVKTNLTASNGLPKCTDWSRLGQFSKGFVQVSNVIVKQPEGLWCMRLRSVEAQEDDLVVARVVMKTEEQAVVLTNEEFDRKYKAHMEKFRSHQKHNLTMVKI